jgi:prefoldin subunit 4
LGSDLFSFIPTGSPNRLNSYKIGDSFVSLPLPEVQEMLSESTAQIDEEVSKLEESLSGIRDEMKELKVQLYARFGRSINLEAS